jgi:hypothetical protein
MISWTGAVVRYAGIACLTLLLWCVLYSLMLARLEPVALSIPPRVLQVTMKEAYPYLSPKGILLWITIVLLYSLIVGCLVTTGNGRQERGLLVISVTLFFVTATFLTLVHPNLLVTLVRPHQRDSFARFLSMHLPALDRLYFHWGFQQHWLWWPFLHFLLVMLLVVLYSARRRGSAIQTARTDQSAPISRR